MKIKKEYIIISVIILASVLYLIFRNDSKVNYEVPALSEIKTDDILSIKINGRFEDLTLEKSEGSWTIEPQGYRALESEVSRLVRELTELSLVDLISPRDDYARYELDDDQANQVIVETTEGVVRNFYSGKASSSSIYTYVRLSDRKGVYSVRGNLKSLFDPSLEKWRDKQVLNFIADEAAALEITKGDENISFTKTAITETPGWSRDGEAVEDPAEIDSNVKSLSLLKATEYVSEEPVGEPQAVLKITTASVSQTLEVYEKRDNGYAARSTYTDDAFLIPIYIGDMILEL